MSVPSLTDLAPAAGAAWPYLVSGGVVLALAAVWTMVLTRRAGRSRSDDTDRENARGKKIANRLTFLVAVAIGALSARGMGHFFYTKLNFPLLIVLVGGGIFEIAAFTCALRARLNIKDPNIGKAGADGVAVWVIAGLSGFFSAMDAGFNEVGLFQLVLPFGAAWLWERGMSIERRKVRSGRTINLRLTPERVLVWLRVAEPSGRTASEVDAHRRLSRLARAVAKLRALQQDGAKERRLSRARRQRDRAMRAAVAHAGLATDPARKRQFIDQLAALCDADALTVLSLDGRWDEFTPVVPDAVEEPETVVDGYVKWDEIAPTPETPENAPGNVSENAENAFPWESEPAPDPWPLPVLQHSSGGLVGPASSNGYTTVPEVFPKQINGHVPPVAPDAADAVEDLDPETVKNAREAFSTELGNGESISVRQIMTRCNCGYPKAKKIKAVLDPE